MSGYVGACGACGVPVKAGAESCPACMAILTPESMALAMRTMQTTVAVMPEEPTDIIKGDIEAALDAEAEGEGPALEDVTAETVQRMVSRPDPKQPSGPLPISRLADMWEREDKERIEQQHYITTICEGAPDDGTGRCPKCHLAIGFDNDYDGTVEGVLRREIKGLQQQAQQEETDAMHSGGILSDVCDIAFDDEGRAMTEGNRETLTDRPDR